MIKMTGKAANLHEYRFFSPKSLTMVVAYSTWARDYAKWLEGEDWVKSFEVNIPLDRRRYDTVLPADIRKTYFDTDWLTDFKIITNDSRTLIREIVTRAQMKKRSCVEKIEFSRRYWKNTDIDGWGVVIMGDDA
mgnify:FL=1